MTSENEHLNPETAPQIDGLEVLELIGSGAVSKVYKARQKVLDRIVALKVMKLAPTSTNSLNRFKSEAKICSTLDHPGMAKVLSYGVTSDGNSPYMVLEYYRGKTLGDHLLSPDKLSGHQICSIMLQLIDVLEYTHEHKVIHRDIKPENILLIPSEGGNYKTKLLDFGIARLLENEGMSSNQTVLLGSPAYMSPEQCESKPADERSDIYALGCVLFEMIFGKKVFDATENSLELLYKKCNQDVVIDRSIRSASQVGSAMFDLIESSLSRIPANRPQNISNFKARFITAMGKMQRLSAGEATPVSSTKPQHGMVPVLILLLLSGAAIYVLSSSMSEQASKKSLAMTRTKHTSIEHLSPASHIEQGDNYSNSLDYEKAISEYKKALGTSNNPISTKDRVVVLVKMANCAALVKNYEATKQYLDRAESLAKKSMQPILTAHVLINRGAYEPDSANKIKCLKQAIALLQSASDLNNEDYPIALDRLAQTLKSKEDFAGAKLIFLDEQKAWESIRGGQWSAQGLQAKLNSLECEHLSKPAELKNAMLALSKRIESDDKLSNMEKASLIDLCAERLYKMKSYRESLKIRQDSLSAAAKEDPNSETILQLAGGTILSAAAIHDTKAFHDALNIALRTDSQATIHLLWQIAQYLEQIPGDGLRNAKLVYEKAINKWQTRKRAEWNKWGLKCLLSLSRIAFEDGDKSRSKQLLQQALDYCEQTNNQDMEEYSKAQAELRKLKL